MKISGRPVGLDSPPYIIAEMSGNHNGSIERALATIDAAAGSGADAIKLQTYTPDTMTLDCDSDQFLIKGGLWDGFRLYDLYKWAHTPFEWHQALFEHARNRGITIFSTPFDETAVDLLESLGSPAYKIASFELTDLPLIRYVAQTGKPLVVSTGMASEQEIEDAVSVARASGCCDLVLLHCISSYPAPIEQSNLKQIPELSQRFGVNAGLSDHTHGTTAAIAAIALGACMIEKHFTLSRQDKGPDSEFSLEPAEFSVLVRETKDAWRSLGASGYARQRSEDSSRSFRRSLYFVKDLPAGHVIGPDDIKRIRPGYGLPPKCLSQLMGRKLVQPVQRGTATALAHFESGVEL